MTTSEEEQVSRPVPEPPAGPDEFLRLDNKTRSEDVPADLAREAERRRLTIFSGDDGFDLASSTAGQPTDGAFETELPNGAGLVLPGGSAGRLAASSIFREIGPTVPRGGLPAHRPTWVDYEPHPKVTTDSKPLMRRVNGRQFEPHYGVFGPDDRQVYYPAGFPWTCVGKVLVWDDWSKPFPSWHGSGVLVGDRTVLTAGHVAPWDSNNWAMQFIPAFYDGVSTLGAGVTSFVSDYRGFETDGVSALDMAVLRLYRPLGVTHGFFGTKDFHTSWVGGNFWTLAGYPGAVAGGNRPSRQMWWPVVDVDGLFGWAEEIEYEADSSPGVSGGPAFGFWNGLPYAIATHSGGEKTEILWWTVEDTNVGAGGALLNSLVAWARNNWPA